MLNRWWGSRGAPTPSPESALEKGRPARTPEDDKLLDRIAAGVVRFGMTVPAIFLLESSKPLSFVGGQFLHFLSPMVHSLVDASEMDRLAHLLERRDTLEELLVRIEREDQKQSEQIEANAKKRKR